MKLVCKCYQPTAPVQLLQLHMKHLSKVPFLHQVMDVTISQRIRLLSNASSCIFDQLFRNFAGCSCLNLFNSAVKALAPGINLWMNAKKSKKSLQFLSCWRSLVISDSLSLGFWNPLLSTSWPRNCIDSLAKLHLWLNNWFNTNPYSFNSWKSPSLKCSSSLWLQVRMSFMYAKIPSKPCRTCHIACMYFWAEFKRPRASF